MSSEIDQSHCSAPGEIARARLDASPFQAIRGLDCHCDDGVLTLTGQVPSYHLMQLALVAIRDISGVIRVRNFVAVSPVTRATAPGT